MNSSPYREFIRYQSQNASGGLDDINFVDNHESGKVCGC